MFMIALILSLSFQGQDSICSTDIQCLLQDINQEEQLEPG